MASVVSCMPKSISFLWVFFSIGVAGCNEGHPRLDSNDPAPVFRQADIIPHPRIRFIRFDKTFDGFAKEAATAVFLLSNDSSESYWLFDSGSPNNGIQGETDEGWSTITKYVCGTGLRMIELPPGASKEFWDWLPAPHYKAVRAIITLYKSENDLSSKFRIYGDPANFDTMPPTIRQVYERQSW